MSFWLGVFSGLAGIHAITTLCALALLGEEKTYDRKTVAAEFGAMVVFMVIAWYLATFGGGA